MITLYKRSQCGSVGFQTLLVQTRLWLGDYTKACSEQNVGFSKLTDGSEPGSEIMELS